MTRELTIHLAQDHPAATVWQVLEHGRAVAHFSTLDGKTRKDAEKWIAANSEAIDRFVFHKLGAK